jgi:hypothetical protein
MPVYAAVGGPVRAAADIPSLLDCPHARLGYQAAFLSPIGVTLQIKPHRFLHIISHTNSLCHAPHIIPT